MNGDLAAIEWYVNSGGTENDFSFKSGSAFVRRSNGDKVLPVMQGKRYAIKN